MTITPAQAGQQELKPCPFCGEEAEVSVRMDESIWSHNTVPYTRVACRSCDIGTDYLCEGWEPTAQEAWNTRATVSSLSAGTEPDAKLCKFYGVTTFPELVAAMLHHIAKLQAKLPPTPNVFAPQRVREG